MPQPNFQPNPLTVLKKLKVSFQDDCRHTVVSAKKSKIDHVMVAILGFVMAPSEYHRRPNVHTKHQRNLIGSWEEVLNSFLRLSPF